MDKNNRIKAERLGMPIGTASNRLRKMILFSYVVKCGDNICFQCGESIDSLEDLSIEHKVPWFSSNNASLFWDLENIAFSHLSCNVRAADKTNVHPPAPIRRMETDTLLWCPGCQKLVSKSLFTISKNKPSGYESDCKHCRSKRRSKKEAA